MNQFQQNLFQLPDQNDTWQAALKKTGVELGLLTDIDINWSLMVEKGIRGGVCSSVHQYAKANNTYMKK